MTTYDLRYSVSAEGCQPELYCLSQIEIRAPLLVFIVFLIRTTVWPVAAPGSMSDHSKGSYAANEGKHHHHTGLLGTEKHHKTPLTTHTLLNSHLVPFMQK